MNEKICDDWKGIMIIEKYCDNGLILWLLKGIMIIEKYCDPWKRS